MIAEDRHSYRVSLECRYSLNPRVSLRVTAHTIDRPQERVKERFKYALKIDVGDEARQWSTISALPFGGFCGEF